ncbi:MAG: hypothetical protein LBG87_02925 [Spirochaetaceae bacterium]|nr:hypothetical protein [Spirochaetaceae bacterium]
MFISGTDQVGETFFADTHLLDTDPSSYEWQSYSSANGWTAIPGATASDYVLTASDEGTYIRLKVSIENDSIAIISGTRGPIRPADPSVTPTNPSNGIGALTLGEEGNITSADLVFSPQNSLYVAGELLTVTLADYLLDNPDTTPENEAVFSDYHWFLDDTDFSDQDGDGTFDTTSFQIYIDDLADGNHTVSFYGRRTVNGNNYYYSAVKSFRVRK